MPTPIMASKIEMTSGETFVISSKVGVMKV